MLKLVTSCLIFYFFFQFNTCLAGAWVLPEGKYKIINNFIFQHQKTIFSPKEEYNIWDKKHAFIYNPYIEYGIDNEMTVGISPVYEHARKYPQIRKHELLSTDIFFRKLLLEGSEGNVLSIQPLLTFPNGDELEYKSVKAELRLARGKVRYIDDRKMFMSYEIGFRKNFEPIPTEFFADITLGADLSSKWTIFLQSFATFNSTVHYRVCKDINNNLSENYLCNAQIDNYRAGYNEPNYNYKYEQHSLNDVKLQLSFKNQLTDSIAFQYGVFTHVNSKNINSGEGFLLSLWLDF
jgi:hypothetical protein